MSEVSNKSISLFKSICPRLKNFNKNAASESLNTGKYIKINKTDNNSIFIPISIKEEYESVKTYYSLLKVWKNIYFSAGCNFTKVILTNTAYYLCYNMILNSNFEILIYLESETSLYINPIIFLKKGNFEKFIASKLYPALVEDSKFLIHTELDNSLYEVPSFKSREELEEALDIMKKELYKKEQLFMNLYNDN